MKKITLLLWLAVMSCCPLFAQTVTTIASQVGIDDDLIQAPDGSLIGSNYDGTALRRLTLDGQVAVFATGFASPNGLAYDSQGNLFMADNQGNKVYKFSPNGETETFATVSSPSGLLKAWDSDTLIVTSYTGNRVVKLAPDGSITEFLTDSRLNGPVGLCYDDDNTLYLANFNNTRIFKVTPEGALLDYANMPASGRLGFIAYRNGYIYATLFTRNQIWRADAGGVSEQWLGSNNGSTDGGPDEARFSGPNGIRFSPTRDTLFISDYQSKSVRMITNLDGVTSNRGVNKVGMSLSVSPNPASAVARARINLPEATTASLQLLDSRGRLARTAFSNHKLPAGLHELSLPVSGLPTGVYHCQLVGEKGEMATQRIVIGK